MEKKILILNYEFPPLGGGASPVSYELSKGYAQLGYKVDVITMAYKGLAKFETKDGMNIYRVFSLRSKKEICHPWEQLTYIISSKIFLKKHLKKNYYDICHCHFIIPTGIVALWLKKKFNIPYIITSHGSDVPGYNTDRFKLLHKFTGPFLKKVCKEAKVLTTPSDYLKDLIDKKIGKYRIEVIPNSSKDFYKRNVPKENIILSSGRLLERKGIQYLIKSFLELDKNDWKLYIAGDGPFRKNLEKLSRGNDNIVFMGWLDNAKPEYQEILNQARIFSLLSSSETQGIVFIEAMSTACAILSSNITACKETVTEDIGFLVERDNIKHIKEKLYALMKDEQLLEKFMKNSRKRYQENFQYENIVKKYISLLH